MEVGKNTKFTLSIETAASIGVTIFMVVGLWFNLQAKEDTRSINKTLLDMNNN